MDFGSVFRTVGGIAEAASGGQPAEIAEIAKRAAEAALQALAAQGSQEAAGSGTLELLKTLATLILSGRTDNPLLSANQALTDLVKGFVEAEKEKAGT